MKDLKQASFGDKNTQSPEGQGSPLDEDQKKGPLSFLSGALTSCALAWLCFGLSKKLVIYFTMHTPTYTSPITESVASGFKTLVIGISFLATFTFSFIGVGLIIVFIRSLIDVKPIDNN